MIHVSDLARMQLCPRLGWKLNRHQHASEPFANQICSFGSLYLPFLQAEDAVSGQPYDCGEDSRKILENEGRGISLRFEHLGLRGKIPYIEKKEDGTWQAVYPLKTVYPKEKELDAMLWNRWLASKAGIDITEHEVVWINGEYVQGEERPLLLKGKHLMKKKNRFFAKTIDEMLDEKEVNFEDVLLKAKAVLETAEPNPVRCRFCSAPRKCAFYEECFETDRLADDSILHLCSSARRHQMLEQGAARLADVPEEQLEGLPIQYAQVMADRRGSGIFMDRKGLQAFFQELKWPLIYLDFEWDTFLFPPYPGMKPFDVLCFQFSMHIEQEDGTLSHVSFFGEGDCRKDFLHTLFEHLPKQGTILVYNMEGAEKLRLEQLARQFPEYAGQTEQAAARMKDLSLPFEQGLFYDMRQRGKSSLKSILPLFAGEDKYKNLEVGNGLEAIFAYRKASASQNPEEKEHLASAISEYCAMDTMAEYDVLHGLQKIMAGQS